MTAAARVGPYTVITALDDPATRVPVPERRYIARSDRDGRTFLVSTPRAGTDSQRFMAEAQTSRYLLGPASSPPTELAPEGNAPWHARPYVPTLALPTALAVHGGPLPEHTVRTVGAALVETLAIGHGQSLVHAGVSPAAVLFTADGPRLGCFGAVRIAAPDGMSRSGLPGLDPGSLPPEQAAGGRPRPLGDVYALGATLAYAATGHTLPERDDIPLSLRPVIARCLARDPSARPQLAELLEIFLGPASASDGPHTTPAGDEAVATSRASALLTPGWLPGRLIAALAHQSAAVLASEISLPSLTAQGPAQAPGVASQGRPSPSAPSRRQD
ncbi:serine/threonine protein kinase [Streptomyces sp. NPDC004082]